MAWPMGDSEENLIRRVWLDGVAFIEYLAGAESHSTAAHRPPPTIGPLFRSRALIPTASQVAYCVVFSI